MYSKKRFFILPFIISCLLCSCSNEDTPSLGKGNDVNGRIYLSFAVKAGMLKDVPASTRSLSGNITDGDIQTGEKDGVSLENTVNNLWVLLYTKGDSDASSILKYNFSFSFSGNASQYADVNGSLLGPIDPEGIYYTSAKIVQPGAYRMVAVANTRMKFSTPSDYPMADNATRDVSLQEWDIMGDLMIPGKFGIGSIEALKQSTNALPGVNVGEELPYNDQVLTNNGILTYCMDDNFTIGEVYNTPGTALVKQMGLKRWLAKVRVTITNTDAAGDVYPSAAGYKLKSVSLMNYYKDNKFFEWDTHEDTTIQGHNSSNLLGLSDFSTDKFPLLHRLNTVGFVADTKEEESELFNFYLGGYDDGLPQETEQNHQFVRLVFTGKTGQDFLYDLPLCNQDGVQNPGYISADKFGKYTLLRNTVYELRIRFKGASLELIDIAYNVKEYTPKEVDFPPFE